MEAARIAAARTLKSTGWGRRIFSRDPLPSSTPIRMMTMDTTRPETYSIRPWPKGWSRSGALAARWKPRSVTTEDPASERLLKASAVMAMEAGSDIESLQKSIYQKDGQEIRLMDKLPGKDREEDRILDHMVLGSLLNSLDQKERQLIYLRYFANRTQTQVGKELGISQVQVSRMEKRILKQMREQI